MNNTIDSKELQEMKAQLALLTQKLEHETIVSQRQIRQSMKDKANYLHWFLIRESIISIIGIPFCLWILPNISRISMLFCATCAIFLAIELFYIVIYSAALVLTNLQETICSKHAKRL